MSPPRYACCLSVYVYQFLDAVMCEQYAANLPKVMVTGSKGRRKKATLVQTFEAATEQQRLDAFRNSQSTAPHTSRLHSTHASTVPSQRSVSARTSCARMLIDRRS